MTVCASLSFLVTSVSVSVSVYLSFFLSVCLFFCLSVWLSVCLSLFVCLSVSPKFLGSQGCLMVYLPVILFSYCPRLYLVKWVYWFSYRRLRTTNIQRLKREGPKKFPALLRPFTILNSGKYLLVIRTVICSLLSVCLSVWLSVCLSVSPSIRLSACMSVRLSVHWTVRLSVFPPVCAVSDWLVDWLKENKFIRGLNF